MKLIKNSGSDRVIDVLRQAAQSGVSVDIASPALSLFAFLELRDLLNQVADSRLILPFNMDSDLTLLGSSADRAARNRLQARWLALECGKWIREKTEVRAPSSTLPQSAYLMGIVQKCLHLVVAGKIKREIRSGNFGPVVPVFLAEPSSKWR
jgi:hypothetical protein